MKTDTELLDVAEKYVSYMEFLEPGDESSPRHVLVVRYDGKKYEGTSFRDTLGKVADDAATIGQDRNPPLAEIPRDPPLRTYKDDFSDAVKRDPSILREVGDDTSWDS